jgi:AcrR family transcriptional regulator
MAMGDGLRERSRERRRAAIEQAALRLFAERGYETTTLAQVAEAAEVSPRTVSLYFPSKLDLALSYPTAGTARLAETVAARGKGRTTLDALSDWLRAEYRDFRDPLDQLGRMYEENPILRGAETLEMARHKRQLTQSLADDLGREPGDVVVTLVGGAIDGVVAALLQMGPERADSVETLDAAVRVMRAAFDASRARRRSLQKAIR